MSPSTQPRIERDSMGERQLPSEVYYGIQTARAIENFPISGWKPYPSLVTATVQTKKAAPRVNASLLALYSRIAQTIETPPAEALSGELPDHVLADPFPPRPPPSHNFTATHFVSPQS